MPQLIETHHHLGAFAPTEKKHHDDLPPSSVAPGQIEPLVSPEEVTLIKHFSAILLAYMAIFESVKISHLTAAIEGKSLEINASSQDELIDVQAHMNFFSINNVKIKSKELEKIETENQIVNALRSVFQNKLTVCQQGASLTTAQLTSIMDSITQFLQQGASLLQMLGTLTNQVSQI